LILGFHLDDLIDMAKVGSPLIDIETSAEAAKSAASSGHGHGHGASQAAPASTKAPTATVSSSAPSASDLKHANENVLATPAVRHLAAKHRLDLRTLPGTGRDGRILKEDILKVIEGSPAEAVQAPRAEQPKAAPQAQPTPSPAYIYILDDELDCIGHCVIIL
jgi:pyruvate/2-oxoglutarate dehydrogenase complex dihydrolipoamide acyltransferase (E2) component